MLSPKGNKLITMYVTMAEEGYDRSDGVRVPAHNAYSSFELMRFNSLAKQVLESSDTVLDYGCGGSNWEAPVVISGESLVAKELFNLSDVYRYEPARDLDERRLVDTVVCFDVLEHLFIADVPFVLRDIYRYAKKSVFLNIAGYPALALLPNGENAHTTVRDQMWWKGVLDIISVEFPHIETHFLYSPTYDSGSYIPPWKAEDWINSDKFVANL